MNLDKLKKDIKSGKLNLGKKTLALLGQFSFLTTNSQGVSFFDCSLSCVGGCAKGCSGADCGRGCAGLDCTQGCASACVSGGTKGGTD